MMKGRSLLTGAAMVLLAAACSDGPTSPREVAAPSASVIEVPSAGPVFQVVPGSLENGPTPPGGVTTGGFGTATGIGGQMIQYSDIKSGNFSLLGWAPGPIGVTVGVGTVPLFFEGVMGGGPDDGPVLGALWTGTAMVTINGQLQSVPVRVLINGNGLTSGADLESLGVPAGIGAIVVSTGTTLDVHVAAEAFVNSGWLPMSMAFSGAEVQMSLAGFVWKIASCDAGNYMDTDAGGCQAAPAGSYAAGGYAPLTQCAAGSYQPNTGQSSCIAADAGYYVSQSGQTSETACGNGKYQPDTGATGCLNAPPGSYATGTAQTSATLCSPGYYTGTYGNTSCAAAPRGTYVADSGATHQTACAAGSYNNSTGQSSCQLAAAGYYASGTGNFTPTKCAAGSYSDSPGSASCTLAPAGSYAPQPSGIAGATSATLCDAGTFTSTAGQASCTIAPAGSYVSGTGATSATPASPGNYVAGTGATSQTQCSAGYYQPGSGATSCIAASTGFYVAGTGATSQTACAVGYTNTGTANTSCVKMDATVAYDALISTAQLTPGVAASEVNKLISAKKQLTTKVSTVCKAIDGFVSYVNRVTPKSISTANAAILIRKTQDADVAIGC